MKARTWLAGLAAVVVLAVGCGEGASPSDREYDPELVYLELNGLFASFGLYTPYTANGEIAEFLANASMDTLLGRTWEYDSEAGTYAASSRTGAPVDAARFILYREKLTGGFELPLFENGKVDIRESGSSGRREASMVGALGTAMLSDLTADASGTALDGSFGIEGVVRSVFQDVAVGVSLEGRIEPDGAASREIIDMSLRMDERELLMESRLEESFGSGLPVSGKLHTVIDARTGLVVLDGTLNADEVEGTLLVNGSEYASFSGPLAFNAPLQLGGLDTNIVSRLDSLLVREILNRWYFSHAVTRTIEPLEPLLAPLAARE